MTDAMKLVRELRQNVPTPPYGPTEDNLAREAWEKGYDLALSMLETRLEQMQRKAQPHPYLENSDD